MQSKRQVIIQPIPPPPATEWPPETLRCPLCGERLGRDLLWQSPHWLCPNAHSYSNVRALIAELRECGWWPGT